jgi:rare lipoprotein A
MYAMTAAHTTLPIPSYARVTSVRTGGSVVVRINDRGPFLGDRLIDLSYVAAYKLGMLGTGSAQVEVESIIPVQPSSPHAVEALVVEPEASPAPPEPVSPVTRDASGVYVQLGAFGQRANAESFLARMRTQLAWLADVIDMRAEDGLYRVRAGPYADRDQAGQVAARVEQSLDLKPAVVTH